MSPEEIQKINETIDHVANHLAVLLDCDIGIIALKKGHLAVRCTKNTFPEVSGLFRTAAKQVDQAQFYGSNSNN